MQLTSYVTHSHTQVEYRKFSPEAGTGEWHHTASDQAGSYHKILILQKINYTW